MKKWLLPSCYLLFIIVLFHQWIISPIIQGGDSHYVWKDSYTLFPYLWMWNEGNGFGGGIPILLVGFFNWWFFPLFIELFHFGNGMLEKTIQFFPYLILASLVPWYVYKKLFPASKSFASIASVLFVANTYMLMLVGGSQINVAIAQCFALLTLFMAMSVWEGSYSTIKTLLLGIVFSLLVAYDLRVAYMIVFSVLLFLLMNIKTGEKSFFKKSFALFIPLIITILLNAFWLLPMVVLHSNPASQLGNVYTSTNAATFFSFAKFEDSISLLHPNWPENIFGLTHFMRPEFLFLPILAFASLLFLESSKSEYPKQNQNSKLEIQNHLAIEQFNNKIILYFAFLGLIGAFLAKGANDPFGGIYLWMFDHVPGFIMFRDPTKWYTLVALSYSVLIPFSISSIYNWLKLRQKFSIKSTLFNFQNIFLLLVSGYLLFLIRPALLGQLTGTFQKHQLPKDYAILANYLETQSTFSRTLWIPTTQRYGFYSEQHPEVSAYDFFHVTAIPDVARHLENKSTLPLLQESAVQYVIVPYDSEGEIFLTDRKYDQKKYESTIAQLQKISWLKQINGFGQIAVFALQNSKGHFWSTDAATRIVYKTNNPTQFQIAVSHAQKGDQLVFSEAYDPYWLATIASGPDRNTEITSSRYGNMFNSFLLPDSGDYTIDVSYKPQNWVAIGTYSSSGALVVILGLYLFLAGKNLYKRRGMRK